MPTELGGTSDARFRALIQHASDVIAILDEDGTVRYKSPAITKVLGYAQDELVGTNPFEYIHPEDVTRVLAIFSELVSLPGSELSTEYRFRHRDGSWRWMEAIATNLLADPTVAGIVVNYRDITERKAFESTLAHQAFHDPLTGLLNRTRFLHHLARAAPPLALLYLDLDGFKVVNDSLGHAAGDQFLVSVAERLIACLGPDALLARLGGDEFAILLTADAEVQSAEEIAGKVLDAVQSRIVVEHRELYATASIGIATAGPALAGASDILRAADIALYHAKAHGKARYAVFTPDMEAAAVARLELEADLRRAVARNELSLQYQPKIAIATGRIAGAEALVRWERPGHSLVHPNEFLPLADEISLMVPIGQWVLTEACRQARDWEEASPTGPVYPVCVNLAPAQVRQPDFVRHVADILQETGLAPDRLMLEITERMLITDFAATSRLVHRLRELGVRLAIDDFGMGSSSLGFLQELAADLDLLKLDRSFTNALDSGNRTVLSAIVNLAHALELDVLFEGIETAAQLAAVRDIGGDFGQGFYFAPPLPPDRVTAMLAQDSCPIEILS